METPITTLAFSEPDEARAAFQKIIAPVSFQVVQRGPLVWRASVRAFGPLTLVTDFVPGGLRLATMDAVDRYILVFPVTGALSLTHGGAEGATRPGRVGTMFSLMRPGRCEVAPGSQQQGIIVERKVLDDHLRKLTGAQLRRPLLFDPFVNLESATGARLERLMAFVAMEIHRLGGIEASPLFGRSLAETVFSALLELVPHDNTSLLTRSTPRLAPRCVRLAEAYIDAHAGDPITIPDVAAAVGVSVRALQVSFRRFRDCSPLDHLKARRLEHARARLLAPTPGLTVSQVARGAGYSSVGYFIQAYERRFGERPGETLARIVGLAG